MNIVFASILFCIALISQFIIIFLLEHKNKKQNTTNKEKEYKNNMKIVIAFFIAIIISIVLSIASCIFSLWMPILYFFDISLFLQSVFIVLMERNKYNKLNQEKKYINTMEILIDFLIATIISIILSIAYFMFSIY